MPELRPSPFLSPLAWRAGLIALALAIPGAAEAQLPVQHDFEDGTAQGWVSRGSAVLTNVAEAAVSGTRSLKTTGRTAAWNGPSLDLLGQVQRDTLYEVRASVRLVPGQAATTLKMTVERLPAGDTVQFDQVTPSTNVTDGGWVTLQGTYRFTTDVTALVLYVESASATAEFYLDDFRLAEFVPDQSGLLSDFEDGTLRGYPAADGTPRNWGPRGSAVLANVTEEAHGGTRSLKVTGRTATWNGPALDILGKMTRGFRYRVTAWVRLAAGEPPTNLRVSIERRLGATTNFETVVPNTPVTADGWVRLSNLFTMTADVDALSIYVETQSSATAAFYVDDFEVQFAPPLPIQTDIPSLKEVLADDFPIGAAVEPGETLDPRHADLARKHFSSLTAGNAMKFGPIHPAEGTYNFTGADTIANFARANGISMRGHTLVWHSQNPDWLFRDAAGNELAPTPENKALMLQRLEDHIRAVVPRYNDVVTAWDVVNEVIDSNQADGLRRTRWYELTGTDYIDRAFQVAREVAAPGVRLCINDFNTTTPAKRQALLGVVQGLLDRGVPVDCVGHQMHVNVEFPPVSSIPETIQAFAALGLDNQITEMDMSVYTNSTDSFPVVPEALLVRQGYRYRDIFREYRRLKDAISSVTVWGLGDDNTWLKTFPITRLDLPLLFDEELQAKHSYWGVVDPLRLPVINQELAVVAGTPRIDGRTDDLWSSTGFVSVENGAAVSARFKLLWDARHLYVLADVDDASHDQGDTVEVFVDENNGKTPTYEADDARYTFHRHGLGHHRRPAFRVRPRAGGYRLEAVLPIRRTLAEEALVGFDIRFRDARTGAVVAWNDFTLTQHTDTSKFGTLALTGRNRFTEAAHGTPVVDGVEEAVWGRAGQLTTGTFVLGSSGATARVKALWDEGHLYLFARVTDTLLSRASANPWEQDSIEIFLDQNNAKTPAYEGDDGQFRVNFENTQTFGGAASAARFVTAARVVPGGYVIEAAVALDAVRAREGTLLGFDLQVNNDEAGDGVRTSVVTWNDPTGDSFRNTSRFGVLRLVARCGEHR